MDEGVHEVGVRRGRPSHYGYGLRLSLRFVMGFGYSY